MDLDLWDCLGRVIKIRIIAKFHGTDLGICSHSRERKTPSYSQRNTVSPVAYYILAMVSCIGVIHRSKNMEGVAGLHFLSRLIGSRLVPG